MKGCGKLSLENKKENKNENIYVKNSVDYSHYGCDEESEILSDSDCLDLLDDFIEEDEIQNNSLLKEDEFQNIQLIEDVDELAMLGFFNEFTLIDIGIGEFIREIYFED